MSIHEWGYGRWPEGRALYPFLFDKLRHNLLSRFPPDRVDSGRARKAPVAAPASLVYPVGEVKEMQHYLLFYDVAEDYLARRSRYRNSHLELAWKAHDRGELVLGGALEDPVDGAILLFTGESSEVAQRFARADPYVTEGLVTRWRVRRWSTVVGKSAAAPLRPDSPRARA